MGNEFERRYRIHDSRIDATIKRLEGLSRTAVKIGLPPYTIEVGSEHLEPRADGVLVDRYIDLHFTGQMPVIAGWRFLAKLEHLEDGNIIKSYATDIDPLFRDAAPKCDHCNTNRARNSTFVVESTEGEQIQVGSSCVDDFVGNHNDPHLVLGLLDGLSSVRWDGEEPFYDPEDPTSPNERAYGADFRRVLEVACAVIRRDGRYVSVSDYEGTTMPTKDTVSYHLFSDKTNLTTFIETSDRQQAEEVLAWLLSDDEDGSIYRHNLRTLAKSGVVEDPIKHLGFAVSAPAAFQRAMRQNAARDEAVSLHIGETGDKWSGREIVLRKKISFDTQWGSSWNVLMQDVATGATLKWTTSSPLKMSTGERYFINATVKGHGEYQGMKQTELTRVSCPDLKAIEAVSLCIASENPEKDIKKVLKRVSNINVVDRNGLTPLLNATIRADDERPARWRPVITALLKAGADPLQETQYIQGGITPLDMAMIYAGGSLIATRDYLDHLKDQGVNLAMIDTIHSFDPSQSHLATTTKDEQELACIALADQYGLALHPRVREIAGLLVTPLEPETGHEDPLSNDDTQEDWSAWCPPSEETADTTASVDLLADEPVAQLSSNAQLGLGF